MSITHTPPPATEPGAFAWSTLRAVLFGRDQSHGPDLITGWLGPRGRWTVGAWLRVIVVLALAGGLGGGSIAILVNVNGQSGGAATFIGLLQCLPFLLFFVEPLLAWRLMTLGLVINALTDSGGDMAWPWPPTTCVLYAIVLLVLSSTYPRRTVVTLTGVSILATTLAVPVVPTPWVIALVVAGSMLLLALIGDSVLGRRVVERQLVEATELRKLDQSRQAVLEERTRIARELHDIVAHHMAGIALQAEAAPIKTPGLPQPTLDTFAMIRDSAREALTETRRVVGLLRESDGALEREPQPGLARVPELVERSRATGLGITLTTTGSPVDLPIGPDVSAYRIVQEALSNASRHAPGSTVTVEIRYAVRQLELEVTNTAAAAPMDAPSPRAGTGHGLVGMRERVEMLGGSISATPWQGKGFRVHAVLPLGTESEDRP